MSYTYTITENEKHICMDVNGVFNTLEELVDFGHLLVLESKDRGCFCYLLNEKELIETTGILEAFQLGETLVRKEYYRFGFRVASLRSKTNLEYGLFIETVLMNRGLSFKAFTDEEEALQWLEKGDCRRTTTTADSASTQESMIG